MRTFIATILGVLVYSTVLLTGFAAESVKTRPQLYDPNASGKEQIKAALETAARENKNVLLKFGANWCGWCHLLSDLFHEDPVISKALTDNYVLVLIDVDKGHNADVLRQYGNPTQYG